MTLTPRQRIVIYRELSALAEQGETNSKRYKELKKAFNYKVTLTCATDGLCATACPVGINTGLLIKELRWKENGVLANAIASGIAGNMGTVTGMLRPLLKLPHVLSKLVGITHSRDLPLSCLGLPLIIPALDSAYTFWRVKVQGTDGCREWDGNGLFPVLYYPYDGSFS